MAKISKNQLEKLQKKYLTDEAIGKLFGITRQAVHQLRMKHGISAVKDKNEERNMDILNLYNEGVAGTKIARRYRLSISQTYRIIKECNDVKTEKKESRGRKTSSKKSVPKRKSRKKR
ncbi:MAG: hypothetical protein ACLFQB_08475 [Chitinispirillaceae bacterium]